jgi:hypothetical protein
VYPKNWRNIVAKLVWNNFVNTCKNPIAFAARASARLPKGIDFDKNRKKLPTPCGLFNEWCAANLAEDWSITKISGGFIVCVTAKKDVKKIKDEFRIVGDAKITKACKETYPIGYGDLQYAVLAGDMGYVL